MQGKNSLIIGGSGFIGRNLSNMLLSKGRKVFVLDKFKPANLTTLNDESMCSFISGNYADERLLGEVLPQVSTIFHLASTVNPRSSNADPIYDIETNLIDFIRFLDCVKNYEDKRIILVSSGGAIYGHSTALKIDENHSTNPESSYGIIKLAQEKYLQLYEGLYGVKYCVLRLANPYGPYQELNNQQGVIANFMNKVMRGEEIRVIGNGSVVRDFFYIEDACDAMIRAEDYAGEKLRTFNIGSGTGCSINELIEKIENITSEKAKIKFENNNFADLSVNVLDVTAAEEILGWKNKISLLDGLNKLHLHLRGLYRREFSG
ncbi:NAD-dependent epimerase/dehydratase family protein [Polynucleobacter paneuropaeus]|nr:NAD-dependent epimerase/dehydratase family protein [Polynucleobacter paneuropaeus]